MCECYVPNRKDMRHEWAKNWWHHLRPSLVVPRDDAMREYEPKWNNIAHFGKIPEQNEVTAATNQYHLPGEHLVVHRESAVAGATLEPRDVHWEDADPSKCAYLFIEFCCSKDSTLCSSRYAEAKTDTKLPIVRVRLTEEHDMTKSENVEYALRIIAKFAGKCPIILWGSLPCTGGSRWQDVNLKTIGPKFHARLRFLRSQCKRLHANFMLCADQVFAAGGEIAYEWPTGNRLWELPCIKRMVKIYGLKRVAFHGCQVGVTSRRGRPIKKPWDIQTTMLPLVEAFRERRCTHKPHEHDQARGGETSRTAFYPDPMCDLIHMAISNTILLEASDPGRHTYQISAEDFELASEKAEQLNSRKEQLAPNGGPICAKEAKSSAAKATGKLPPENTPKQGVPVNSKYPESVFALSGARADWISLFDLDNLWIFDSGCGRDLVALGLAKMYENMYRLQDPIRLHTANGIVCTSLALPLQCTIGKSSYEATPYLLENTPSVLSMGVRCARQGFAFIWLPYMCPCLVTPQGEIIPLDTVGDVPCVKADGLWQRVGGDPFRIRDMCGVFLDAGSLKVDCSIDTDVLCNPCTPGPLAGDDEDNRTLLELASEPSSGADSSARKKGRVASTDVVSNVPARKFSCKAENTEELSAESEGSTCTGTGDSPAATDESESEEESVRRNLYAESISLFHYLNHKPGLPQHCDACRRAKLRRRRRASRAFKRETGKFGDILTCDHVYMKDFLKRPGVGGTPDVFNVLDIHTHYKYSAPVTGFDSMEMLDCLQELAGTDKIKTVYADSYPSYKKAISKIEANYEKSIPGIHHSNAIIERCNLDIQMGTRVILAQAGLPYCFWPYASPYYCHVENVIKDEDGNSPWLARHGQDFTGKLVPFGCGVHFLPSSVRKKGWTNMPGGKADTASCWGIFLGYRLAPGGKWTGQYIVAEIDQFANMPLDKDTGEKECYVSVHITDQVVMSTDLGNEDGVCFPLKRKYNQVNFSLESRDEIGEQLDYTYNAFGKPELCVFTQADADAAKPDLDPFQETSGESGSSGGSTADPSSSGGSQPRRIKAEVKEPQYFYTDSIGRKFKADEFGSKVTKRTTRPPYWHPKEWEKVPAKQKLEIAEDYAKELEDRRKAALAGAAVPTDLEGGDDWGYKEITENQRLHEEAIEQAARTWAAVGQVSPGASAVQSASPPEDGDTEQQPSEFAMPLRKRTKKHRKKRETPFFGFHACIARPINKKEIAERWEECKPAMDKEWNRLFDKGVFDTSEVREWRDVAAEANRANKIIHMGRVFGIMVEKNYESVEHRKIKYRVVFQGNNVVTQNYEAAMFQDLGSQPASMEAGKATDAYGCIQGHAIQQADAEQAYIQADLEGADTWVMLPEEAYPDDWYRDPIKAKAMRGIGNRGECLWARPVVKLKKALYGHPDSGTMWEKHCHKRCLRVGFEPIPNWPSCYQHKGLGLMLTIYVDDFKLSGPTDKLRPGWKLLESVLELEPEGPDGRKAERYLGCLHIVEHKEIPGIGKVTTMTYEMEDYLRSICNDFEALGYEMIGPKFKLREAATPFLTEDHRTAPARAPNPEAVVDPNDLIMEKRITEYNSAKAKAKREAKAVQAAEAEANSADLSAIAAVSGVQAGQHSGKQAHSKAKQYKKKANERSKSCGPRVKYDPEDPMAVEEPTGELQTVAASILMRLLYAARYARFDLLRSIAGLARFIAYWDKECDKKLIRLVGYVKYSLGYRQMGWIGNKREDLAPHVYSDADFAGCPRTLRSTSGVQINLEGTHSCFPLQARSVAQPCVSFSTPEAELVALTLGFRTMALTSLDLWDCLLYSGYKTIVHEDNTATIQVVRTGRNPTMRYIGRTHGISIQFLHENLGHKSKGARFDLQYTLTTKMVADIHTKAFNDALKWEHATGLCGVMDPNRLQQRIIQHAKDFNIDGDTPGNKNALPDDVEQEEPITSVPALEDYRLCRDVIYVDRGYMTQQSLEATPVLPAVAGFACCAMTEGKPRPQQRWSYLESSQPPPNGSTSIDTSHRRNAIHGPH